MGLPLTAVRFVARQRGVLVRRAIRMVFPSLSGTVESLEDDVQV